MRPTLGWKSMCETTTLLAEGRSRLTSCNLDNLVQGHELVLTVVTAVLDVAQDRLETEYTDETVGFSRFPNPMGRRFLVMTVNLGM